MCKLIFVLLAFVPAVYSCGGTPILPPPASTSQVNFVKEMAIEKPVAIDVDEDGWVYMIQADGTLRVTTGDGLILTHKRVERNGKSVLKKPAGIAVDEKKIFVIDRALCQVVVFSAAGRFLDSFGCKGSGFKEFRRPSGIQADNGIIYVADTGNDRIQLFSTDGVFLQTITGSAVTVDAPSAIPEPIGVDVDYRGVVYVTCAGSNGTKMFLQSGNLYKKVSSSDNYGAIAVGSDGFYVTDQKSFSILKYDFKGKLLFSFGSEGRGKAQFVSISDLAVDAEGNVYVADKKRSLVQVFHPEKGDAHGDWEKVPPPTSVKWVSDIYIPTGKAVWVDDNTFYVVDSENGMVLKITDGGVRAELKMQKCKPASIALDEKGSLWVLDGMNRQVLRVDDEYNVILRFGSSGSKAGQFRNPSDIAIDSAGIIYVSDPRNRCVQAFNNEGILLNVFRGGKGGAEFLKPVAIAVNGKDVLHVLDSERCAVTVFSSGGKLLFEFGKEGKGKGEFIQPVSLFATTTEVFVLDAGSCSIKVFDSQGSFVREFGAKGHKKGDFWKPTFISPVNDTVFSVSDSGNKRIQVLANVYSPAPPIDTVAESQMHAVRLSWRSRPEPYVSSYRVYRSERENGPFADIGVSKTNKFVDKNAESNKTYYYLVAAQAMGGREGGKGNLVKAESVKYMPSVLSGLKAIPHEWSVDLSWDPAKEDFVTSYVISREVDGELNVVGKTEANVFSENCLAPDTSYTFRVEAVSSDGKRGLPAIITTATVVSKRPPLEIRILEMKDIFSNTYKIYENEGMGHIRLINNTCEPISRIKLLFTIKEFMDFPSEEEIDELPAGTGMEIVLRAVFNNKILKVTEDMPVQTEIKASYYKNKELNTFKRNKTVNIYEKHRMTWDEKGRFVTFITPKDPLLLEFIRSIVTQYGDAWDNIQRAAVVFNALGVMGMTYMQDPSNPYQITSGMTDFVDYIQYPRETLQRKSGDCDDLVALYASALESLGIKTLVVDNPGHILLMFSTGIKDDGSGYTMGDMFVIRHNMLWVPVETTLVGNSFIRAWEEGSKNCNSFLDKGLSVLDIQHAWNSFKPASLPPTSWRPVQISRKTIEARFHDEFKTVRKIWIKFRGRKYLNILENDPGDKDALLQMGIIYAKAGETRNALKLFEKVLAIDPRHAAALNNIGNVYFFGEKYIQARDAYKKAVALEPQDPLIWVNLARCCKRLNMISEAEDSFRKACALDPTVSNKYRAMALELLGAL